MTTTSTMRRAILAGIDAGERRSGYASERIDEILAALDRAGFCIVSKADALAAARCANNAVVLGVSDADPDLGRRLEPNT
jgi:hypothetical protein